VPLLSPRVSILDPVAFFFWVSLPLIISPGTLRTIFQPLGGVVLIVNAMLLEHRLTLVLRATRSASAGFDAFGFFFCGETALLALRFAEVFFVRWRNVNSLFRREYDGGRGCKGG
jgi:hypothetical protein